MATRLRRDPTTLRRAQATLELALDVLDDEGLLALVDAAERALERQSEQTETERAGRAA